MRNVNLDRICPDSELPLLRPSAASLEIDALDQRFGKTGGAVDMAFNGLAEVENHQLRGSGTTESRQHQQQATG